MIIVYIVLAAVLIVLAVCAIRAAALKSENTEKSEPPQMFTDSEAIERFQKILQKKTVWPKNGEIDYKEFESFLPLLKDLYPDFFSIAETELINDYGILIKWSGSQSELEPVVLMSHYDVVEADESKWKYPPFEAQIHDGDIIARGAVDTKCILAALLEAASYLHKSGYKPRRDIWFSFSNNEETGGPTSPAIVEYLKSKNVKPWIVIDEGGAIVKGPALGVKEEFAMIGVSEKGVADVTVTVSGEPGHSSTPRKSDSTTRLIRAIESIEKNKFKSSVSPVLEQMLKGIASKTGFAFRFVLGNMWLFRPIVKKILESNGETAAMIRTTTALTMLSGANQINIIPPTASAGYSVRIAPGDTVEGVVEHIRNAAGENAEITVDYQFVPSPVSDFKGDAFIFISETVSKVYPNVTSVPYIMNGGTDSKHFARICPNVYRFAGIRFTDENRAGMHGNNESLSVENYYKGIDFYIELIRSL